MALQKLANHLGMFFVFFRFGFPVYPDGRGMMLPLAEPPQQAGPFVERPHRRPERALQAMRMIRQEAVGRVGMADVAAKLERRSGFGFPQRRSHLLAEGFRQ